MLQHSYAGCDIPSYKLLAKKAPGVFKTIQVLVISLGYLSELDDKTLLMKTPHILVQDIKLELK